MSAPVHTHQEQPHTSNQNTSSKGTAMEPKDYGLEILDKASLKENGVQTKLTIGAPDDPFEKEANAMASYAVGKICQEQNTPTVQAKCEDCEEEERRRKLTGAVPPRIQRKCAKCEKKRIQLKAQSKSGSPTSKSDSFTSQLHSQQGLGSPLPKGIKGEMEAVFGADFGGVRVHEGAPAVQMNQELGAKAFTHQSDIYFNKGQFQPGTAEGKKLVAHELTHVVQQGAAHQSADTPSVQTDLLDDALDAGSNLLSQGADAVSGAVDYGREGIASLVGRFSPGLARIIRVGPLNFIKEKVGGLVKGWFENLQNGIGFGDMVTGLRDWLGDSVADIRGAITGDAKSCTAFGKMIESVRGFVFKALEHPVLNMIRGGIQKTNDVIAKVLSMYIQGEIQKIKFIWEGLQGLGSRVSGWIDSAKEGLGVVWGKAKEFLGITEEGEAGVMDWISGLANDAWDFFKNKYIPFAIKAFKTGGKLWFKLSGLEAIYSMVTAIGDFWETFSWLWEHRNDPDLVAKAAKDEKISKTILPRILEKAQNLQATIKDTQKAAISWVDDLILKVLGAIGIVTEVPILSTIVGFLEKINRKLEQIRDWIIGTLSQLVTAFGAWVSNLYQQIKPILSIAAWLLIAVAVPGALPVAVTGILAAGLFAIIPTCYKGPVMDLLLDIAIKAMKLAPDVPMFGPLWSLFKPGVIEFLQVIRDKSTEEKLAVIKRVAELLVFSGIDFLLGFGWGLIKGIFEGIFDPFILIYYAGKGLVHLISWFSRVANQYFGDATPAPPLFGGGADKPKKKEAPLFPEECSDDKKGKAAGADTAELESLGTAPVMQAGPAVGASAGEGSGTALATPNPAVGDQIWGWMNSLAEPAYTIRNNFTGAINEYFSQSGGMDYNSIQSKFGQWWGAAQGAIAERSGKLANCMVATLLSPGAQKIASKAAFTVGEVIGWISGTIIIEVVLFLLSSGLVTVTKAILKPLVWLAKLIDKIGDMFMVIFKVLKPLGKMFMALGEKLFSFFGKSAGAKMAKVMEAFSDIGRKLLGFVDNVPGLKLTETGRALAGKGLKETGEKGLGKTLAEQSTETAGKQGDQVVEEFGEAGHKELLDQARRKQKVDDMTEAEFRAELGELAKNPKTDVSPDSLHFEKYDIEVKVNGHTYRRRRDGKGWCRFTLKDCLDKSKSDAIDQFLEDSGDLAAKSQKVREGIQESKANFETIAREAGTFRTTAVSTTRNSYAILDSAVEKGKLTPEQAKKLLDYINDTRSKLSGIGKTSSNNRELLTIINDTSQDGIIKFQPFLKKWLDEADAHKFVKDLLPDLIDLDPTKFGVMKNVYKKIKDAGVANEKDIKKLVEHFSENFKFNSAHSTPTYPRFDSRPNKGTNILETLSDLKNSNKIFDNELNRFYDKDSYREDFWATASNKAELDKLRIAEDAPTGRGRNLTDPSIGELADDVFVPDKALRESIEAGIDAMVAQKDKIKNVARILDEGWIAKRKGAGQTSLKDNPLTNEEITEILESANVPEELRPLGIEYYKEKQISFLTRNEEFIGQSFDDFVRETKKRLKSDFSDEELRDMFFGSRLDALAEKRERHMAGIISNEKGEIFEKARENAGKAKGLSTERRTPNKSTDKIEIDVGSGSNKTSFRIAPDLVESGSGTTRHFIESKSGEKISLDAKIRDQIYRYAFLQNQDAANKVTWEFLYEPSKSVLDLLEELGIDYIIYIRKSAS